eukprot:2008973-Pyramimonas_sp.AAC.1
MVPLLPEVLLDLDPPLQMLRTRRRKRRTFITNRHLDHKPEWNVHHRPECLSPAGTFVTNRNLNHQPISPNVSIAVFKGRLDTTTAIKRTIQT